MHRQKLELCLWLCFSLEEFGFFIHSKGLALSLDWQPDVQGRGFQVSGTKGKALGVF